MRINFRELKQQVRLTDLLTKIGWKSTEGRGEQLRGPCPLPGCSSKCSTIRADNRSFSLHTSKNVYHCFRCGSGGDVLDFWKNFRKTSRPDAAKELWHTLGTGNRNPF